MSINRELDKDAIQDLTFTFTRNIPKSVKMKWICTYKLVGTKQSLMSLYRSLKPTTRNGTYRK